MAESFKNIKGSIIINDSNLTNVNFNKAWEQHEESIDLEKLSLQLSELKKDLLLQAKSGEDYAAIANVASAEEASKQGDGSRTMQFLAKAGNWALDTATKIGVTLAAAVLKDSIGVK
ncbi:hypothetical protein [Mucilaginibacter sp.]|uniref:hypothetical protein n=1 Tax=Mucilaginibacter sp. TaxID=1882438 RepID=UPI0025F01E8E|nr:hypothetical protein [Mucilaginibacter sp.]